MYKFEKDSGPLGAAAVTNHYKGFPLVRHLDWFTLQAIHLS